MQDLATVFDFLFGCHHSNLSRVFTIRRQTYRVCCDCGTAFKVFTRDDVHRVPSCPAGQGKTWWSQAMATCGLGR